MIVLGIALFGAGLFGAVRIAEQVYHEDYQLSAFCKWGNSPRTEAPDWAEDMAKYDLVAYTYGVWEQDKMETPRKELQKKNLDILIGEYMPVHTLGPWMRDAAEQGLETPTAKMWRALSPYLAVTTEGDTATIWKNHPLIDLFNPEAVTEMVRVVSENAKESKLDWYMMDFFQVPMPNLKRWQDPIYEEMEHGDLDFDRDGIGHWDDPDERMKLRDIYGEYIQELRAAMPPNMVLIPNGSLAMYDPLFAKHVDGCYIEGFPRWFFGTQAPNYPNAFDPEFRNSLFVLSEKHRWYSDKYFILIEDMYHTGDFGYIAQMFDGGVESHIQNQGEDIIPNLPVVLDTGKPIDKPHFIMDKEYLVRTFANGTIEIKYPTTNYPIYNFRQLPTDGVGDTPGNSPPKDPAHPGNTPGDNLGNKPPKETDQ